MGLIEFGNVLVDFPDYYGHLLSSFRYCFKRLRTYTAKVAVSASSIVERFNLVVDLSLGDITGLVDSLLDPLFLQAAKERFGHCVIPAVPTPAHAGLKAMRAAKAPPSVATILRTLI